mmetsp:Transcript_20034/g.51221  ORF Transcript_20034/g.51221 Transcript_20034/m.51221 type:complete len:267 (-) Transcript_20034:119-919(-)
MADRAQAGRPADRYAAPEPRRLLRGPHDRRRHDEQPDQLQPGVESAPGHGRHLRGLPRLRHQRVRGLPVLPRLPGEVLHDVQEPAAVHGAPDAPAALVLGELPHPRHLQLQRAALRQAPEAPDGRRARGGGRDGRHPRRLRAAEGPPHGAPLRAAAAPGAGRPLQARGASRQGGDDARVQLRRPRLPRHAAAAEEAEGGGGRVPGTGRRGGRRQPAGRGRRRRARRRQRRRRRRQQRPDQGEGQGGRQGEGEGQGQGEGQACSGRG